MKSLFLDLCTSIAAYHFSHDHKIKRITWSFCFRLFESLSFLSRCQKLREIVAVPGPALWIFLIWHIVEFSVKSFVSQSSSLFSTRTLSYLEFRFFFRQILPVYFVLSRFKILVLSNLATLFLLYKFRNEPKNCWNWFFVSLFNVAICKCKSQKKNKIYLMKVKECNSYLFTVFMLWEVP